MDGEAPGMGAHNRLCHKLGLPWRLSKRKCEGNGVMEYCHRVGFRAKSDNIMQVHQKLQQGLRYRSSCGRQRALHSFGQEQSFASLLRWSPLGADSDTTLLEAQAILLGLLEGREARENQNQD